MKTWTKWKQAYLAAYARGVNRQCVGATDDPFSQAANLVMLPATHDVKDNLAESLDNLALVATSDRTTVQKLIFANLSLTVSVATLTATNNQLTKMVARCNLMPEGRGGGRGHGGSGTQRGFKANWGNYC
jgi:hypothetical protein